jgi:hypothetical protein
LHTYAEHPIKTVEVIETCIDTDPTYKAPPTEANPILSKVHSEIINIYMVSTFIAPPAVTFVNIRFEKVIPERDMDDCEDPLI